MTSDAYLGTIVSYFPFCYAFRSIRSSEEDISATRYLHQLNPPIEHENNASPTYLFLSDELRTLAPTAYDTLSREDRQKIPPVTLSNFIPYRTPNGTLLATVFC